MIRTEEEHLAHYGILRRSGRYPWGSGGPDDMRNKDFPSQVNVLKKEGWSEKEIATGYGMTIKQLRDRHSVEVAKKREQNIQSARRLKEKGWSNVAIANRMVTNESTIRSWLSASEKDASSILHNTAEMLKNEVSKKTYIDVGKGVEHQLGVTRGRLDAAIAKLKKEEGYTLHKIYIQQTNIRGKYTSMNVLAKPGVTLSEVQTNRKDVKQITEQTQDYGRSWLSIQPPISVNPRRVGVVYGAEGAKADGMIYIRPGVKDLRIGEKRYGQVRILVDGTHYLKGMAVYKEDLPAGKDIVFNTKAKDTGRKKDAMKKKEDDPDNPFGAIIRQVHDSDGKVSSAVNLVGSPTKEGSGEEGSWDSWSKNLSSQFLSKQDPKLIQRQLDLTFERRQLELKEIQSLTNAVVKKDLLDKFADSTDAASVHLKAAALPRQSTKVLIPIASIKPTEVYAPNLTNGDSVVLIRYPHGGKFEIPRLTVNNKNREARKLLGIDPQDAIGIHHSVAQHLSGADFDGDTVLAIRDNHQTVKSENALEGLKNFDPLVYKIPKGSGIPEVTGDTKQDQMGRVSNLITDMTLQGANHEELAHAIKHSMVVIDSEKHQLNWAQSEKDNGILQLKEKYQGGKRAGAQTLVSRARAPAYIPERRLRSAREGGKVDPVTGKLVYVQTGRQVVTKSGQTKDRTQKAPRLSTVENAYEAIAPGHTPTNVEVIYAEHSNRLKAMANEARKESLPLKGTGANPSAKKTYANEVASLDAKLRLAERNAPYERQAHLLANAQVSVKRQANPDMPAADEKKIRQQALNEARIRTGANKHKIDITQKEWDAIQAYAISPSKLDKIINNSDSDTVKQLAMPKFTPKMTNTKKARAIQMLASGATQQEVADVLGVGLTTLKVSLKE